MGDFEEFGRAQREAKEAILKELRPIIIPILDKINRLICWVFGHDWQPSPNEEIWFYDCEGNPTEPYGVFVRCQRCREPDPLWPFSWYPDEEEE